MHYLHWDWNLPFKGQFDNTFYMYASGMQAINLVIFVTADDLAMTLGTSTVMATILDMLQAVMATKLDIIFQSAFMCKWPRIPLQII